MLDMHKSRLTKVLWTMKAYLVLDLWEMAVIFTGFCRLWFDTMTTIVYISHKGQCGKSGECPSYIMHFIGYLYYMV